MCQSDPLTLRFNVQITQALSKEYIRKDGYVQSMSKIPELHLFCWKWQRVNPI